MQIGNFEHNGNLYEFQPPIEVGNNEVDSLSRLAAIAFMGPDTPEDLLALAGLEIEVELSETDKDVLAVLNTALAGQHSVSVE